MSASNSVVPLSTVKYLDPRIDVLKKRMYAIERGGQKIAYIPYQTNSTGNNAMQFSVIPPSRTTFVDRQMFIQASIQCTFTADLSANTNLVNVPVNTPQGTIAQNSLVFPSFDAPRSYPLSRALQSASLQVGNASLSMNTSDVIDPLLRIMKKDNMYYDECPSALDNCQRYEEMAGQISTVTASLGAVASASIGNNVLGNNIQYLANGQLPRGCYKMTVGAPNLTGTRITQIVTFEVFEPVFLSPLCYDALHSGLIGLQNINLLYNFSPSASQLVWSGTPKSQRSADGTATGDLVVNMSVNYTPTNATTGQISRSQLWVGFISPSSLMSIPPQINYNYDQVECYTTQSLPPIAYNGKQSFFTQNIQLKVVPKTILVGVRKQLSQCTYQDPHAYFQIQKASFNFDNNVGLLSNCDKHELYSISKKNGLNYDYASWLGEYDDNESTSAGGIAWNNNAHGTGSLLVINPAEDFGLGDAQACGVAGAYNFQVNLDVKCLNKTFGAGSNAYECIVVVINDGELAIDVAGSGNVTSKIGLITEADVLSAPLDPNVDVSELEGNGWLSGAKSFLKKALPIVKDVAPLAIEAFKKAKAHLDDTGSALIGSGVGLGYGKGVGRGGRISKLSLKDRLN
jgi:hypothetical protein